MDWNNVVTLAGVFIGAAIAAYVGYSKKWPVKPPVDPVLAGVGLELSNREQIDRLIAEVKRIADALTDKNTEAVQDRLEDLAEKVDAALHNRTRR